MIFLGVNRITVLVNTTSACRVDHNLLRHADFVYKRDEYTGMWSFIKYRFDTAIMYNMQFFSVECLHQYIEDSAGIPKKYLGRVLPLGPELSVQEAIKLMRDERY